MSGSVKSQAEILQKLGIQSLNPMQQAAGEAILAGQDLVLLSPTGSGKTLAFLLPVLQGMAVETPGVQSLILAPSRELAMQILQVAREMGTGFKVNALYGGRPYARDKQDLLHQPQLLIGTPGRIADHIRRGNFGTDLIRTLVLDEFDKSLEVGFEQEMKEIIEALPGLQHRILTSATQKVGIPGFVGLEDAQTLDFLHLQAPQLRLHEILSPDKDKLQTLGRALRHLGPVPGIVFCNFRDSIERVSDFLNAEGIGHGCFHGGMEQRDRELSLVKFRNGTHRLIVATDLAARGLDVPEIRFILHYHLPGKPEEFTHRNGRTARMNADGSAYLLRWEQEELPDFIPAMEDEYLQDAPVPPDTGWRTLEFSGGRLDKISKGDVAGLLFKVGQLAKGEVGQIELHQDRSYAAVPASRAMALARQLNGARLKKKKVLVRLV